MAPMELSPQLLFAAFPTPVFLLQSGEVRYRNEAAVCLFPALAGSAAVPEELAALLPSLVPPAVVLTQMAGRTFRITVQDTPEGTLVFLHPGEVVHVPHLNEQLSFQLRQQTAGLSAALQRLAPTEQVDDAKRQQYLSFANQGLYRLLRLADHLDVLGRADGDLYRPAPLDFGGLCREVADGIEDLCRVTNDRFSYETALTSLVTVGDDQLLRRMLLALLSNAMKAACGGSYGLRLTRTGGRAVVTVWDNGPDLSAQALARLFGSETDTASSLDPKTGLGLGFATVRRIAALHGGTVMVESQGGLRVVVSLPLQREEEGLPLHTQRKRYGSDSFSPLLVELSDILPAAFYAPEDLD